MNLAELVDRLMDIDLYDQPPAPDTDDETPLPWEEEDTEDNTTIKPKMREEELVEEDDLEEEPAKERDFDEQWAGNEDLEKTTLEQESGEIPIEEPDMEGILAAEEEPKPEVVRWKREKCGRMCRVTCPLDA